jgi:hypothetical protein
MQNWTPQDAAWWATTWVLRLAVLLCAFLAWGAFERGGYWSAATYAGMAALALWLQRATRRQALGWFTDDNGERHKITHWNRGHPIYVPTSRGQRLVEEAETKSHRRKLLLWLGLFGWGFAIWANYLWPRYGPSAGINGLFYVTVYFGGLLLFLWFLELGMELLYLSGWQDMKGAKVLDPPSPRPGLDNVMQQKVHGEGRVATEEEALALLNPRS